MAAITFMLAKHPQHVAKLRQELELPTRDSPNAVTHDDRVHLEHLNAVINETLRLYPPVPTTIYRLTPDEGVMIDDVYIPGGMSVMAPQYAIGRSKLSLERFHGA